MIIFDEKISRNEIKIETDHQKKMFVSLNRQMSDNKPLGIALPHFTNGECHSEMRQNKVIGYL